MKNMIPLIVAVVLGLAAVFAVSRALSKNGTRQYGKEVSVLVANGNLKRGSVMSSENFRRAVVPSAYVPKQHILGDQDASILGQTLVRDIAAGDYILWNDFGRQSSVGESVGEGEWAVPVSFENARQFAKQLKPGDEIAVVGMFEIQEEVKSTSADARAKPETVKRTVTTVLFPQVRIMSMSSDGSVLLSLPPQQAPRRSRPVCLSCGAVRTTARRPAAGTTASSTTRRSWTCFRDAQRSRFPINPPTRRNKET